MLCAIVRLLHSHWTRVCLYMLSSWHRILHFASGAGTKTETDTTESNTPEIDDGDSNSEFPAATDDQRNFARRAFIDSLDPTAVCALASQHNNGKACRVVKRDSGSFNVCFFVDFHQDGPKWIVRIPIEPALENPRDKLLSEVATIQSVLISLPLSTTTNMDTDTSSATPASPSLTSVLMEVMPT